MEEKEAGQKKSRKLELNRETVRGLTSTELDGVAGGLPHADLTNSSCSSCRESCR